MKLTTTRNSNRNSNIVWRTKACPQSITAPLLRTQRQHRANNTTTTTTTIPAPTTETSHANTQTRQQKPIARVDGADQIDTGPYLHTGCDKKRRVVRSGNILVTCGSEECFQKWGEQGRSHDKQPCWATLNCQHLQDDNVNKLKKERGRRI